MIDQYVVYDIEYGGLNKLSEDFKLWGSTEIERQEIFVWDNSIRGRFGTAQYHIKPYHIISDYIRQYDWILEDRVW